MEEHDVTNAEFSKFVEAAGYVTTAEHKIVGRCVVLGENAQVTRSVGGEPSLTK